MFRCLYRILYKKIEYQIIPTHIRASTPSGGSTVIACMVQMHWKQFYGNFWLFVSGKCDDVCYIQLI